MDTIDAKSRPKRVNSTFYSDWFIGVYISGVSV